jgi:hypothetical protein
MVKICGEKVANHPFSPPGFSLTSQPLLTQPAPIASTRTKRIKLSTFLTFQLGSTSVSGVGINVY